MLSKDRMTVTIERDEREVEVDLVYFPGDPGRYSGRPEDCYPAEAAEVEVKSACFKDTGEFIELTDEEFESLEAAACEVLNDRDSEAAIDAFESRMDLDDFDRDCY